MFEVVVRVKMSLAFCGKKQKTRQRAHTSYMYIQKTCNEETQSRLTRHKARGQNQLGIVPRDLCVHNGFPGFSHCIQDGAKMVTSRKTDNR